MHRCFNTCLNSALIAAWMVENARTVSMCHVYIMMSMNVNRSHLRGFDMNLEISRLSIDATFWIRLFET